MIVWKVCPSYPDYEVSEYGGLRRCRPNRKGWMSDVEMRHRLVRGYPMFGISVNCRDKKVYAHHLVLEAFIGPKPFAGAEGCHGDGVKTNNHYTNLRWDTAKANQADRITHGTNLRGEKCPVAKLTDSQVVEIKQLLAAKVPHRTIAPRFNVSSAAIGNISRGAYWKHI